MTNEKAATIINLWDDPMCPATPEERTEAKRIAISVLMRDRWISVEERLPEHHNWCLVLGENLYDMDFINSRGVWHTHDKPFSQIMFWRPLPEPPKEN